MKDDYKDGFEPQEEYHPASTKGTAAFLIGIACALFGDTCLYFHFSPGVLLFFVGLLICVVWIVKERQKQDRQHYREYKKMREWAHREPKEEQDIQIDFPLDGDKFKKGGVRPGSRPSEEYKKRIEKRDAGKKD